MPTLRGAIDSILSKVGYPLLIMSGIFLHCFTVVTAYKLGDPGWGQYAAAAAAFAFPPVAEAVVAYYAWRASGSMVNGYSVWLLMWLAVLFAVGWLTFVRNRLRQ